MRLYFIAICLLFLGGLVSIFVKENQKMKTCAIASGISAFLLAIPSVITLLNGNNFGAQIYISPIFETIDFIIDPLSAFFILVISIMSFIGITYANGYIKPYINKEMHTSSHCFFLMMLIISMIGVVSIHNSLFFLIMWEIMSLSSFFLIIFENEKKEVIKASIKYFIYMHISVIFIILAFALAHLNAGGMNFIDFTETLKTNPQLANIIFLLAFVGFGTKAGFVPFHNWLPDAHPAAPSHVSGIMSGIMIKTGIYGILRTLFLIGTPTKLIAYVVLVIAALSAIWGVLYAITQHDIKRLLAYHSIENIGIIGMGIGIGMLGLAYENPSVAIFGFAGGILHILNHSIFKMLLFFAAGNIYLKTHTKNIEELGGLIKKMPHTALLFIIGSMAICGLPPFNGFISELLIYAGMILGLPAKDTSAFITIIIALGALALVGTMAILCFTKVSGIVFLGNPRSKNAQKIDCDAEKIMLIPMSILAILTLVIGLFPQYAVTIILTPIFILTQFETVPEILGSIINMLGTVSILFFVFLTILSAVCGLRILLNKNQRVHNTWGCGYNKPNNRMQYTASSYASLFISTLKPMFKRVSHIKKPKDLFPKEAYYEVEIQDIEEAYLVKPLIKFDEKILAKFERIQNGNIQQYILFGLIFLVLAIIGLIYWG